MNAHPCLASMVLLASCKAEWTCGGPTTWLLVISCNQSWTWGGLTNIHKQ